MPLNAVFDGSKRYAKVCVIGIFAMVTLLAGSADTLDACAGLIPSDLRAVITKTHPGYRLPRQTDQDAFNVDHRIKEGGIGCLGVARGDFDCNRGPVLSLFLAEGNPDRSIVVAALRIESGWRVELIEKFDSPVARLYVDSVDPGTYESRFYGESPPEPNERKKIVSRTQGVAMGALESTATYYFRSKGRWLFVWISD